MPIPSCPVRQMLCLAGLLLLSACGQKGPLYLPQEPAAAQRATLPQSVFKRAPPPAADQPRPDTPAEQP